MGVFGCVLLEKSICIDVPKMKPLKIQMEPTDNADSDCFYKRGISNVYSNTGLR